MNSRKVKEKKNNNKVTGKTEAIARVETVACLCSRLLESLYTVEETHWHTINITAN